MSIKVMSRVWDSSQHKGTKLLLLLAIADYTNDEGYAWPSIPTLAKKLRMSERYVQVAIRQLIKSKELKISYKSRGGSSNTFQVTVKEKPTVRRASPRGIPHREARLTETVRRASPNPSRTVIKSPKGDLLRGGAPRQEKNEAPLSVAEKAYLKEFKLKKWVSDAQRKKFQDAEALVGGETMLEIVKWAATNGVANVSRIYTAATRWRKRPNTSSKPKTDEPAGFEAIREYRRRKEATNGK